MEPVPPETLSHEDPVFTCHWYARTPESGEVAVTLKIAVELNTAVRANGCTEIVGDPGGEFVVTSDLVDSAESK